MSYFLNSLRVLVMRDLKRFYRQKSRIIGTLATPLMFWLLLGGGLGSSFQDSSQSSNYMVYFFPGSVVMSVLFTAIFSTMSVIEDRNEGFLQGILVSPFPKLSMLMAKIISTSVIALIQALLLLLMSPLVGYSLGINLLGIMPVLFLLGASFTSVGFIVAWVTNSTQGYHGFMNLLLMPMWFLSGSLFPLSGSHAIFKILMKINPITYGVDALRVLMLQESQTSMMASGNTYLIVSKSILVLLLFTTMSMVLAMRAINKSAL